MRAAAALVRALLAADDAAAALGHARGSGARAAILYSFISRALRARAAARVKQPEATQSQRARLPGGYPPGLLHAAIPYSFGFCSCSFCFRRCSFCFCSGIFLHLLLLRALAAETARAKAETATAKAKTARAKAKTVRDCCVKQPPGVPPPGRRARRDCVSSGFFTRAREIKLYRIAARARGSRVSQRRTGPPKTKRSVPHCVSFWGGPVLLWDTPRRASRRRWEPITSMPCALTRMAYL